MEIREDHARGRAGRRSVPCGGGVLHPRARAGSLPAREIRPGTRDSGQAARMGRTIALDYGERRIGVALSDPTRTIASPLTTLQRRAGKRPPWAEIGKLIVEHEVEEAVIGLPLDLAGEESAWTAEVRQF